MGELLMDLWSFMKRAEKILALSYHHVAGSARRIIGSYFGIDSCALHLRCFLE